MKAERKEGKTMFYDVEHDLFITATELENEFNELKKSGGTDCKTFSEYVRECTSKNGTLEKR
jgi:hypothetical protein